MADMKKAGKTVIYLDDAIDFRLGRALNYTGDVTPGHYTDWEIRQIYKNRALREKTIFVKGGKAVDVRSPAW
jgi:hypothetical protein